MSPLDLEAASGNRVRAVREDLALAVKFAPGLQIAGNKLQTEPGPGGGGT